MKHTLTMTVDDEIFAKRIRQPITGSMTLAELFFDLMSPSAAPFLENVANRARDDFGITNINVGPAELAQGNEAFLHVRLMEQNGDYWKVRINSVQSELFHNGVLVHRLELQPKVPSKPE